MRLTIIPEDKSISIDGIILTNIQQDFSWIPDNVHAVQWYDTHGHVEYTDTRPNLHITELGIYEKSVELLDKEQKRREEIEESLNDYEDALIRIRNRKLYETDWTQLPNSPLTQEQQELWAKYRQELRDLPKNIVNDPKELVNDENHPSWPIPPWTLIIKQ
jgi:hypothetical protein